MKRAPTNAIDKFERPTVNPSTRRGRASMIVSIADAVAPFVQSGSAASIQLMRSPP